MLLNSLGKRTQKRLAILIMTLIENEQKLESSRLTLTSANGSDPTTLFRQIDSHRLGYFSTTDLSRYLQTNCINASPLELQHLMCVFGGGEAATTAVKFPTQSISHEINFKVAVLDAKSNAGPQTNLQTSLYMNAQLIQKGEQIVDPENEFLFLKLVHQLISNFKAAENKKAVVVSSDDYTEQAAFKAIDLSNFNRIDTSSIQEFLLKNNREAGEKQIGTLIQLYGNKKEQCITPSEFAQMITPTKLLELKVESSKSKANISQATVKKESGIALKEESSTVKKHLSKGNLSADTVNFSYEKAMRSSQDFSVPFSSCYTRSAMKGDEEKVFVSKIDQIVRIDITVEERKQELAMQSDFNLLDAFAFMDVSRKGFLTQEDFFLSLKEMELNPQKHTVYLFFKEFAIKNFSRLEFSEFVKAMLPAEQSLRSSLNNRVSTGKGFFSQQTMYLLQETLIAMLANVEEAEIIRQELNRRRLFDTYDAFCALDQSAKGFIQVEDIRQLLVDFDVHFSMSELQYFFKRFDKALDGEVTYGEFFKEITPKCPYQIDGQKYIVAGKIQDFFE